MEGGSKRGMSQYVWEEVWRQVGPLIVDHLGTGDWWKASGASIEMFKVQPNMLCMQPTSRQAACWISRHWREAQYVDLDFGSLPDQGPSPDEFSDIEEREEERVVDARTLMRCATRPSCVQAMRFVSRSLDNMNILEHLPLRHLELTFTSLTLPGSVCALGSLAHLETLLLKSIGAEVVLPRLDLRRCARLRAFASSRILLKGLKVPSECLVQQNASLEGLTSYWSRACTSCICRVAAYDDADDIQSFLSCRFGAVTYLHLGHISGHDGSLELGQNLPNLQSLSVSADCIHLKMTAPLQLTSLQALAVSELTMDLGDRNAVARIAATLLAYRFRCEETWLDLSDVKALLRALKKLGKRGTKMWVGRRDAQLPISDNDHHNDSDRDSDNGGSSDRESEREGEPHNDTAHPQPHPQQHPHPQPQQPQAQPRRMQFAMKSSNGPPAEICWVEGVEPGDVSTAVEHFAACLCGACWTCLEQAGSLQRSS